MVKQRKIIIALLLSLLMAITATASAQPANISGHWAETQIQSWLDEGLASGYPDGTFKPNREVSRAEFVAMVNRAFGIESEGALSGFADVKEGQWFYADVMAAKAKGYFGGYPDGTFKPQNSISRQEAASSLARLLNLDQTTQVLEQFEDSAQIPQWSRGSVGALVENGLMGGYPDNTFKPTRSITRAEAVATLDRARNFAPGVVEDITLQGTVKSGGKAVSGAAVNLFEAGSYEVLKETETDANGHFEFKLAEGNYDITAVTNNKVAYKSDLELVQGEDATVSLDLEPAAIISGTLKDENDKIIKDATLFFTTNPTFVLQTGDDGKFTGAVLPSKTYTVRTYEPDAEDEEPVIVSEELAVGAAGYRSVGVLNAPFAIGKTFGGGGSSDDTAPSVSSVNAETALKLKITFDSALSTTQESDFQLRYGSSDNKIINAKSTSIDSQNNKLVIVTLEKPMIANLDHTLYYKGKSTEKTVRFNVTEKDVNVDNSGNLKLPDLKDEPVRVKAEVDGISFSVDLPQTDSSVTINAKKYTEQGFDENKFVGLELTVTGLATDSEPIVLSLPKPKNVQNPGAFHLNGQVWEYRDCEEIDGKIYFATTLSKVAIAEAVDPPIDLLAKNITSSSLDLVWDSSVQNPKGYNIYRNGSKINEQLVKVRNYYDNQLSSGTTYNYCVSVINSKGFESDKSDVYRAKTLTEQAESEELDKWIGEVRTMLLLFALISDKLDIEVGDDSHPTTITITDDTLKDKELKNLFMSTFDRALSRDYDESIRIMENKASEIIIADNNLYSYIANKLAGKPHSETAKNYFSNPSEETFTEMQNLLKDRGDSYSELADTLNEIVSFDQDIMIPQAKVKGFDLTQVTFTRQSQESITVETGQDISVNYFKQQLGLSGTLKLSSLDNSTIEFTFESNGKEYSYRFKLN